MKKIPIWLTWDWKSIKNFAIVIIFGSFLLLIFFRLPDWIRNWKGKNLSTITTGSFISSKPIKQLSQGETGNTITTDGYIINYSYWINNKIYYGNDNVPNSLKNSKFIHVLFEDPAQKLNIKYDPVNPKKSQIIIPSN
jgi:hypothetical protein